MGSGRKEVIGMHHSVTLRKQMRIEEIDLTLEVTTSLSVDGLDAANGETARAELTDAALAALEKLESRQ